MSDERYQLDFYDYELPSELIAKRPAERRDHSKLLVYHRSSGRIEHALFKDLPSILSPESCLVFNRSRVFPCRIDARKETGGKAEIFVLSLSCSADGLYPCLIKSKGRKELGQEFFIENLALNQTIKAVIQKGEQEVFWVDFQTSDLEILPFLNSVAKVPIPPYIRDGLSDQRDRDDYQTVYAKESGSVAAPTAGLHFTKDLLDQIDRASIQRAELTLHVGMGTFSPVRSQDIRQHHMHKETFFIDEDNLTSLNRAKKVIAVGTTSLRALESCYNSELKKFILTPHKHYETDIFLYPGKPVNSIDGLITNFHLPKSSLLMLVSAIIGRDEVMKIYRIAIEQKYRFFSYGDAMCIL